MARSSTPEDDFNRNPFACAYSDMTLEQMELDQTQAEERYQQLAALYEEVSTRLQLVEPRVSYGLTSKPWSWRSLNYKRRINLTTDSTITDRIQNPRMQFDVTKVDQLFKDLANRIPHTCLSWTYGRYTVKSDELYKILYTNGIFSTGISKNETYGRVPDVMQLGHSASYGHAFMSTETLVHAMRFAWKKVRNYSYKSATDFKLRNQILLPQGAAV
ncbi:unnamed protein product [Bursaphelenchus okinawaensis]|uniref:Uncharacterized protein n=1 Tax=Bursaphelenchus okinawaensis TaxID=465554 RepID=A0A811LF72_9BILA|nr:unnamed protein product [Bursaphelenchus okinawaensis]CAG9122022.1 unnamed protein product [Bursaphelenchus okinawaensis]